MTDTTTSRSIAIVGLAGRFPGARDLDEFWSRLRAGIDALVEFDDAALDRAGVPAALRADPRYVRRGTHLDGADLFDASFFGISPGEAQVMDPQHRIFLECAWEALENAGYAPGSLAHATGVYAGASMNTYLMAQLLRDPALVAAAGGYQLMLGNDKDFLATRVAYKLDLHGPAVSVQTACSTSLVAVQMACRALQHGECDMALAGGVSATFPQQSGYLYQEGMILSPDGHCRPFDARALGTRPGAGCGLVVLKRLSDAIADGDTIHAVIRGAAVNNDGAGKAGYTAPSVDGQVEVIATAQALAGVDPRSIGYVEAHGTGTPLGDPIEIAALTQVFRAATDDVGFCRLGSLKANLGHLDVAAGVAGLIKAVLALEHEEIPPLAGFESPNPHLGLSTSPFTVPTSPQPWPTGGAPRRAGVSSFGIGGTNAHVVLEEAPAQSARASNGAQLLVLSARSASALDAVSQRLAARLARPAAPALADVAFTLQAGRRAFAHRRIVVAADATQAVEALGRDVPARRAEHAGGERRVAFMFSGQGSQHPGMGAGLYRRFAVYRDAVDRCAELLRPHLDLDLRDAMLAADATGAAAIHETRLAQPALFTTEYALACLWMAWGVQPAAMIGHSIGEFVCAHLAGVMSLEDALALVAARGRLMQAQPVGSMAAVPLGAAELRPRLEGTGVEIAAVNGPGLCAVSGPTQAVAALVATLAAAGIDARPLRTSHAFHSAMMELAVAPFEALVARLALRAPSLAWVSNVSGTWITEAQATSPAYWARHLRGTVEFDAGLATLAADASLQLLEVGPGQALASLARIALGPAGARRVLASLGPANDAGDDATAMLESAGRLWLAGVELDAAALHAGASPRRVPLPTYPFERKRFFVDGPAPTFGAAVASERQSDVARWFLAPTWARDDTPAGTPLDGTWLLLGADADLAPLLAARLQAAGAKTVLATLGDRFERIAADRFQLRIAQAEDVARMSDELRASGQRIAGAIVLWCLDGVAEQSQDELLYFYHAQVALAAGLAVRPATPATVLVVTRGGQGVLDEPVHHGAAALALGPVLALPTEIPGLRMRLVDVALDAAAPALAQSLAGEAAAAGAEPLVAWRAGRRWVRRHEPVVLPPVDAARLPLKQRGVYLVTGGLGGVGLAVAADLARRVSARLVLTTRGAPELPAALQAHAADVLVLQADAADETAMRAVVERALAAFGGVDGVIHAAGIAGEGRLALLKQAAEVEAVLSPKVVGLDVLGRVLGARPLDFVVLMSSINAVVAAPGVADYAAANAVLDAFVDAGTRPAAWRHVVALDWSAWGEVGMAAKLVVPAAQQAAWRANLAGGIPTADGIDALWRALASGRRRLVITPHPLPPLAASAEPAPDEPAVAPATTRSTARGEPPADDIERQLAAIWFTLLGVEHIGRDDDFFDLGGHSLMATRVMARVADTLGAKLTLRDVFEAPRLRDLAARIAQQTHNDDREEIEF